MCTSLILQRSKKKIQELATVLARFSPNKGGHFPICDKHGTVCKVLKGKQALLASQDPVTEHCFFVCDNPEQCYFVVSADTPGSKGKDLEQRFINIYREKVKQQHETTVNKPKRKATLYDIDDAD